MDTLPSTLKSSGGRWSTSQSKSALDWEVYRAKAVCMCMVLDWEVYRAKAVWMCMVLDWEVYRAKAV